MADSLIKETELFTNDLLHLCLCLRATVHTTENCNLYIHC